MKLVAGLLGIAVSALSLAGCTQPKTGSVLETALRSRFSQNEFHVVWTVGDQAHPEACGLVHVGSAARYPNSGTLFIVVQGRAYTPNDVPADEFLTWGKQLCGPDWVAPNYISPVFD